MSRQRGEMRKSPNQTSAASAPSPSGRMRQRAQLGECGGGWPQGSLLESGELETRQKVLGETTPNLKSFERAG